MQISMPDATEPVVLFLIQFFIDSRWL